ncbi:hypothetical protein EDD65_10358 [Keratinibaculum paraultunense]|uniref:Uncharacterized protein n=1 Tax=Keratinibaculum paraultunense TaxID=1278232 RepID=A0A4R3L167_9FIRM|nr:hypothetical protein [Keratinibaculum paraultunense]QQY80240.1 hypothetical protein JL105_02575 [Keratinibaculum paraultunense]TCS90753.1 hypothetical protein EDD65_10358 [Keratinibaculum paraultunense]
MINIIDTFEDFKNCFANNLNLSIEEKIKLWEECYISKYPELEHKCKNDYEDNGYHWRDIAKGMVFNRTKDDFDKMIMAYENILEIMAGINEKVELVFSVDLDINIVLYCGLLNSAGWVDEYGGKRAILYGIDKIAELNWHTIDKLKPLLSHELCHIVHFELRGEDTIPKDIEENKYSKGIWRIYTEGFAQFFQKKLLNEEIDSRGIEWENACKLNEDRLKELYLEALKDKDKGTNDFFGDWFQVLGLSDTGYFLGKQMMKKLKNKYNIVDIAKLSFSNIEKEVIEYLERFTL